MEFEWDTEKYKTNIEKHGLRFELAVRVFQEKHVIRSSVKHGENRNLITGFLDETFITIVYTQRAEKIRIISARKASRKERESFYRSYSA